MKKTKKMMALVIAVVMMMAMTISASAATIKVNSPVSGQTYTAYKLFNVTQDGSNYSYTIDEKLSDSTDNPLFTIIKAYGEANANTFTLSNVTGTTIWNVVMDSSFTDASDTNDVKAKAFATYLNTEIDDLSDEDRAKLTKYPLSETETPVEPGYYFVDSTFGSLCVLKTANDKVTITEKNAKPTLTKKIVEGANEVSSTTASIGDVIKYKLTVTVPTSVDGAYEITDTMEKGLCNVAKLLLVI